MLQLVLGNPPFLAIFTRLNRKNEFSKQRGRARPPKKPNIRSATSGTTTLKRQGRYNLHLLSWGFRRFAQLYKVGCLFILKYIIMYFNHFNSLKYSLLI